MILAGCTVMKKRRLTSVGTLPPITLFCSLSQLVGLQSTAIPAPPLLITNTKR